MARATRNPRSAAAVADQVGRALQALRRSTGVSLSELARRSGVGKATLSELEAGHRNPTLETLCALTTALGVPLGAVLPEPEPSGESAVVTGQAVDAVLITRFVVDGATVETYRITVRPDAPQHSAAHTPGTTEHLVVLAGIAEVGAGTDLRAVGTAESHTWAGDSPHTYSAKGDTVVDAILVMRYPRSARARS
jgi:transcriptional regulator with XRE-family HTH domain